MKEKKPKRKIPWVLISSLIAALAGIFGILNDGFGVFDRVRPEPTASPITVMVDTPTPTESENATEAPADPIVAIDTDTTAPTPEPQPTATLLPTATYTVVPPTATSVPPTATPVPPTPTSTPIPEPEAGATKVVNDIVFVYIAAGTFTMGSNEGDDDEKEPHPVNVDAFWMMQTEVTKAQYSRCVQDGACTQSDDARIDDAALANHPVVNVTWHQATAFAEWIDGRLPTEAEWEYACRGTDGRIYPWGNEAPNQDRLNYLSNVGDTTEVGRYPVGANGLYDMAGNVWEWTSTQSQAYPYAANDGREEQGGDSLRTLRGGSFNDTANSVRCAYRLDNVPKSNWNDLGFRIVVVESPGFLPSEPSDP